MTTGAGQDILVIGAGLAGLALARDLTRAGRQITVLDKSRGVSGRSSTRRTDGAKLDHGARFFTARSEQGRAFVQEGLEAGWLAEWTRSVPTITAGSIGRPQISRENGGHPRYVPPAGMNTLGHELARGVNVHTETQVTRLEQTGTGWRAECQDGRFFEATTVVLNMPAPQIVPLLVGTEVDVAPLQAVRFDPCWSVGAVLRRDVTGADWPALRVQEHESLDWIAREHSKRPPGSAPSLMLHARADWSTAHLHDDKQEVQEVLLNAAQELIGELDVEQSFAHRWLYATPTTRYPEAFGWRPERQIGWCGDWCTPDGSGPRVEAALLSGWGLAERLVARSL
jgi:renalase